MKKRWWAILLMALVVLGGSGCMKQETKQEQQREMFEAEMNHKYDDTFGFVELVGSHMGSQDRTARMTSERYPDAEIIVQRKVTPDQEVVYTDNYFSYVYEDAVEEALSESTKKVVQDARCLYQPEKNVMDQEIGEQPLFDAFLEHTRISAVILTQEDWEANGAQEMERLREQFQKDGIFVQGLLLTGVDPDAWQDAKADDIQERLNTETWYQQRCDFCLDEYHEFIYMSWR